MPHLQEILRLSGHLKQWRLFIMFVATQYFTQASYRRNGGFGLALAGRLFFRPKQNLEYVAM